MKKDMKKIFNMLVNVYSGEEAIAEINMQYKSEDDLYVCLVILETGEIVFDGYAWVSGDVVLSRSRV